MSAGGRSFKSNLEGLIDELDLAFRWKRPSILVAVHGSSAALSKALEALRLSLVARGRRVVAFETTPKEPDIAHRILEHGDTDSTVYFVSQLERGGGTDSFVALNLYRELFVEHRIKLVLWLTEEEANALPRLAPDFWAFRHRVIQFLNPPVKTSGRKLVPLLLWHESDLVSLDVDLDEKIRGHEGLLADLPQTPESLALRLEEHYQVGRLLWAAGQSARGLRSLATGIRLAGHPELSQVRARLLNGAAIIAAGDGKVPEALKIYEDLLPQRQDDQVLLMNRAICLCGLGRNHDGLEAAAKAAARDPENPVLLETLGLLQLATGRLDDAAASLDRSLALAPRRFRGHESLAVCHAAMGLTAEALKELDLAASLDPEQSPRHVILRKAILGDLPGALDLLASAIRLGRLSRPAVARDPVLNLLLDPTFNPETP